MEEVSSEKKPARRFIRRDFAWSAVQRVTHDGMSQRRQMGADLVRSARLDPHFQKRELAIDAVNLFEHLPVCNGFPAIAAAGCHAGVPFPKPAYGGVGLPFLLTYCALHERDVG